MTPSRTPASWFVALLATAMIVATYLPGALSVLSSQVTADLEMSASELGLAFSVFSITGALSSPAIGHYAARNVSGAMSGLMILGALSLFTAALAADFRILLLACLFGGLALGAGNPSTNLIVSQRISTAKRGIVVGIKQSGPPLALFAAGILLPPLAEVFGWRLALGLTSVIPIVGFGLVRLLITPASGHEPPPANSHLERSMPIYLLSLISVGVTGVLSAIIAFLPLYGQSEIGLSATTTGLLAGATGLIGVASRVAWGGLGDRLGHPSSALMATSVMSIVAIVAIGVAMPGGAAFLWLGAILVGSSLFAWHSIAWIVVIEATSDGTVAQASGILQLGTSIGFAAGPPMIGIVIETTASYELAWVLMGITMALVTGLTYYVRSVIVGDPTR